MEFNLLFLLTLLPLCTSERVPLTLLDAEKYPNVKCLDGTPAGHYTQMASNDNDKNKWVVYLNGGGECDSQSE